MKTKPVLQSETFERKEFKYTLGAITLSFTLRTDVKTELVAFKSLLEKALKDVQEEIFAIK